MDSANSGSMQSSSGGDEEYDSRFETPFGAYNTNANVNISSGSSTFLSQSSLTHPATGFFDNFQAYLDPYSRSPPGPPPSLQVNSSSNPLLNLDCGPSSLSWVTRSSATTAVNTQQSCTDMPEQQSLLGFAGTLPPVNTLVSTSGNQRLVGTNPPIPSSGPAVSTSMTPTPRGSKKRPRASRRAPTTVLTTDTTNFRQMVQEFTGIPSPPFSSSTFPRSRFDLFNAAAALRSSPGNSGLLRPFAQKVPIQIPNFNQFFPVNRSSSSSTPTTTTTTTTSTPLPTSTSTSTAAPINTPSTISSTPTAVLDGENLNSTINYQLQSDLSGLLTTNINPMFTLQSLLQSSNPSSAPTNLINLPQQPIPRRNQYSGLFTPAAADGMVPRGGGSSGGGDGGGDLFGWGDGNSQNQQVSNSCKMYNSMVLSSSSSDFPGEMNRSDHTNVSSRGDGLLDSWISSSD